MIDSMQLAMIMPLLQEPRLSIFTDALNSAMSEWEINTPERIAAFLGQVAYESGQLRYMVELASGATYEGREDLGNTELGDGVKYKGRGPIQITGKTNYQECGDALGLPLIDQPELLIEPVNGCRSAGWFWWTRGLNQLADKGDYEHITRRINGGLNGEADREAYHTRAMSALGIL